jgi:formylglycine-generating enzyme required for sulfatase activity
MLKPYLNNTMIQKNIMQINLIALLLSSLALSACAKTPSESKPTEDTAQQTHTSPSNDPALKDEIKQLIERNQKNMVTIQGGSFIMGDFAMITRELENTVLDSRAVKNPKGNVEKPSYDSLIGYSHNPNNKPPHKVVLDSFKMTNNKVTLQDYLIYLKATHQEQPKYVNRYPKQIFHKLPAGANWYNAQKYCQWLGSQIGESMDLPTEAQWEYAARNRGQYVLYATNDGTMKNGKNISSYDQLKANKTKYGYQRSGHLPVLGEVPANPLGLYDMVTNNNEWVRDWYSENYYAQSPIHNPTGPEKGELKVMRSSFPQGGDNASRGDGMNINRQKLTPSSIVNENGDTIDISKGNAFRCVDE